MSDVSMDSGVVESTPTTTAEAAEAVIDAFAATETTGVEVSGETPEAETTPEAAPVAEVAQAEAPKPAEPQLSPAAQFLLAQGHKHKKADGRDNWLPIKTVEGMLDRYAGQRTSEFETTRTTLERERDEFRSYVEEVRTDLMGEPRAFIEKIASIDPRWKAFLEPQAAPQAQSPAPDAQMPEPDLSLGDGSRTYSLEGIQKLLEWNTQKVLNQVDQRIKPITEREQKAQEQAKQQEAEQALAGRVRQQMEAAKGWANWADYEGEVLKKLQADSDAARAESARTGKRVRPTMTLKEAYLEVKADRLSTDHNKVREKVLAEIKQAPKATSVSRQTTDAPRTPGVLSVSDIAARTLERLERGA
jgi:hypothetical protein